MFDPPKIDHLNESFFELEGAHYLYREAMAERFRGAGDGSARAEDVEILRGCLRAAVQELRCERARHAGQIIGRADAATASTSPEGNWAPEHLVWLDSLLGADAENVKRHIGVLGFD